LKYLAIVGVWGAVAVVGTLDVSSVLIMAPCAVIVSIVLAAGEGK